MMMNELTLPLLGQYCTKRTTRTSESYLRSCLPLTDDFDDLDTRTIRSNLVTGYDSSPSISPGFHPLPHLASRPVESPPAVHQLRTYEQR